MPLLVTIKNVPHSMFSWKGLSFIASPVGEPIRLHQETQLVTNFEEAKIFVDVDLSKSLPKSYYFNIKGEGEKHVTFEYPWLPKRCGCCKKWGHSDNECLSQTRRVLKESRDMNLLEVETEKIREELSLKNGEGENKAYSEVAPALEGSEISPPQIQLVQEKEQRFEAEEGEIVQSSITKEHQGDDEGIWREVSPLGSGKSKKNVGAGLVYGQVQISSPSLFAVLLEAGENGEVNQVANLESEKVVVDGERGEEINQVTIVK